MGLEEIEPLKWYREVGEGYLNFVEEYVSKGDMESARDCLKKSKQYLQTYINFLERSIENSNSDNH